MDLITYAINKGSTVKKMAETMFGAEPIVNKEMPTATLLKIACVNIDVMNPYLTNMKLNTSPIIISSISLVEEG